MMSMNILKIVRLVLLILVGLIVLAFGFRYRRTIKAKTSSAIGKAKDWLVNEPTQEDVTA